MTRYHAVIFDLDGVLVDSEPAHRAASRVLVAPQEITDKEYARFVGAATASFARWVRDRFHLDASPEEIAARYDGLVREQLLAPLAPLDGATELLAALTAHGVPLALASQSLPEWVRSTLEGAGLADAFRVVVTAAQVARPKPAPDIYLHAAQQLDVPPAACLVIEDSIPGVASGLAAGMTVIQTRQGSIAVAPQPGVAAVIESLRAFDTGWVEHGIRA